MFERSYHFVPADRPKLFDRVSGLGADASIFDLEDAVAGHKKLEAISFLSEWLASHDQHDSLFVRVNGLPHALAATQKELLARFPHLGVVLPKLESSETLLEAVEFYEFAGGRPLIGLIENASGLLRLPEILSAGWVTAVGLGLEDFLSDSIFDADQLPGLVASVRSHLSLQAMAFGVPAIDTVSLDLTGGDRLRADVATARSAGMNAKFTIHPNQIEAVNEGFSPSADWVAKARKLARNEHDSATESGYSVSGGEILSPPKLKKLHTIREFFDHHERNKK